MFVNKAIALQIEECIKQTHMSVIKQSPAGRVLELGGGSACFSGVDSFLSQVIGWGFKTEANQFKEEIETFEQFYQNLGNPGIAIEFCPYAGSHLAVLLSDRGYKISELNNVSYLDLNDYEESTLFCDPLELREIAPGEINDWARRVAIGFGVPDAREYFEQYARAEGVTSFGVFDQKNIVAGATIALNNEVCDLGVTSTIPVYRGQGLQKKLLLARLHYAKKHQMKLAAVTTDPGSISDANIQKIGFRCAYTRIKFQKRFI